MTNTDRKRSESPPPQRGVLARALVPDAPRDFYGKRWVNIALRTAHIATFGVLVGGHVFDVPAVDLHGWLYAAIGTGAAMMAIQLHASFAWLREVRGAAIVVKLALLCTVAVWWQARVAVLMIVIVISSFVSHMPGRYRYWVIGVGPPNRPKKGPSPH